MKKIIGIYLLLQAAMKGVCFFLSLSSDESFLPVIVLVTCAVLMAGAVYVLSLIHIYLYYEHCQMPPAGKPRPSAGGSGGLSGLSAGANQNSGPENYCLPGQNQRYEDY